MSALIAEAQMGGTQAKTLDVISEGLCLILGAADVVLPAAAKLQDILGVTVLLSDTEEPPMSRGFDAIRGQLRSARGALGGFRITVDALQSLDITGRTWTWSAPVMAASRSAISFSTSAAASPCSRLRKNARGICVRTPNRPPQSPMPFSPQVSWSARLKSRSM